MALRVSLCPISTLKMRCFMYVADLLKLPMSVLFSAEEPMPQLRQDWGSPLSCQYHAQKRSELVNTSMTPKEKSGNWIPSIKVSSEFWGPRNQVQTMALWVAGLLRFVRYGTQVVDRGGFCLRDAETWVEQASRFGYSLAPKGVTS